MSDVIADLELFGPLRLRRAWPRPGEELALEYVAEDGGVIAAKWASGDGVTLVPPDADARLTGLAAVLEEAEARLVSHRAERRAVVRLPGAYAKVVRPQRLPQLVETLHAAERLPVTTPRVLAVDAAAGVVRLEPVPGMPFSALDDASTAASVGRMLRNLHATSPDTATPAHTANEERTVVLKWLEDLEWLNPDLARSARKRAGDVLAALAEEAPAAHAPIHRDLHDGQIVVSSDGAIGVLDFDTLARGEPALDIANLLVHLELAALLGTRSSESADRMRAELLAAYDAPPETARRLPTYMDAARLRLTCVHAFRPGHKAAARALLENTLADVS